MELARAVDARDERAEPAVDQIGDVMELARAVDVRDQLGSPLTGKKPKVMELARAVDARDPPTHSIDKKDERSDGTCPSG